MKYIKPLKNTLKRNFFLTLIVRKTIPENLRKKLYKSSNKDTLIRFYFENDTALIDLENKKLKGLMPVFYWDSKPNFGDFIGPYLISKITGMSVLNIQNLQFSGIMAVGSIMQMLDRKNMTVWGSGLIEEPTDEVIKNLQKYEPEILSVRGSETAKFLLEAGIDVPDKSVYGDPALILPLFYKPPETIYKKIGVCPHHMHKEKFLSSVINKDYLKIIDVQKDVENVVNQISSSTVCISTSLHGLIIAQAYNIPWVWLEIIDDNLIGNDFKFKDFFSSINASQVSCVKVKMEEVSRLDFKMIAKGATLPDKLYDEKLILKVLEKHLQK